MVATWKIVSAAVLIFTAGVVTGGITTGIPFRGVPRPTTSVRPAPATGGGTNRTVSKPPGIQRLETIRRVCAQLELPAEKRQRLDYLIDDTSARMQALWNPMAPRLAQEIRDLRHRIDAELPADQKARFDVLVGRRSSAAATNTAPPGRIP